MKAANETQRTSRPVLSFQPSDHPGELVIYTAATESHTCAIHHDRKAHGAHTAGSWFLTLRVAGGALGVRSRHRTLTIARRYAASVLAATTGPTHADLLAAAALVDAGWGHQAGDRLQGQPIVVIACGAAKLTHAAPAAELYTSGHFILMLRAAHRLADSQGGRVLVLSALHGLVELDTVLAPYDVKMGAAGCVTPDVLAGQLGVLGATSITTLLPRAYAAVLDHAAELAGVGDLIDMFADAPGIGYQRGVAARILNAA